jgi:hypothetical protein
MPSRLPTRSACAHSTEAIFLKKAAAFFASETR